jgi:hypothetical protein
MIVMLIFAKKKKKKKVFLNTPTKIEKHAKSSKEKDKKNCGVSDTQLNTILNI